MAIAYDANAEGDNTSVSSLTVSHTCTGSDRLLIVCVASYTNGGSSVPTGVTYNSVAMTKLGDTVYGLSDHQWSSLWGLKAPATTANNIVVSWSGTEDEVSLSSVSYTGVDQTTPWGTASINKNINTTSTSISISSETGDLVVDGVSWYNGTITVGANQTQRAYNDNTTALDSCLQSEEAGGASITMSHSWSAAEYSGHVAVNINAASAAVVNAYNGASWDTGVMKDYNGSSWDTGVLKAYNGSAWVP